MGTVIEIKAYHPNLPKAEAAISQALKEIEKLSARLSVFEATSEISRVNREAHSRPVKVSPEVFAVLKEALSFSKISNGAFDITVKPLMELWGFHRKSGRIPTEAEIKNVLKDVGWQKVILDEKKSTVFLTRPGVGIDLGGIAKGDAADRAAEMLRQKGISSALINAGGNIYALGGPAGRPFWTIGIRHPRKNKIFGVVLLKNMASATSGDYENFFIKNGSRYGHIINPHTGRPAGEVLSVTIVAKKATDTDGLSTAIFVLGKEKGPELIEKLSETFALIIYEDEKKSGKINYILTKGAEKYFQITRL